MKTENVNTLILLASIYLLVGAVSLFARYVRCKGDFKSFGEQNGLANLFSVLIMWVIFWPAVEVTYLKCWLAKTNRRKKQNEGGVK